jgi:hypothetical protein
MLGAFCPNVLYPFAREAVADLIGKGGFPPVYLAPVNFDALYAQKLQEIQAQVATGDRAAPPTRASGHEREQRSLRGTGRRLLGYGTGHPAGPPGAPGTPLGAPAGGHRPPVARPRQRTVSAGHPLSRIPGCTADLGAALEGAPLILVAVPSHAFATY